MMMLLEGSILRVPGYGALVASRLLSSVSVWFDFTLIFSALTFHWQADPSTVGLALALYGLPGIIVGPVFGSLSDKWCPGRALAAGCISKIAISLLLATADHVHVFVGLIFVKGVVNVAMMPVEQVLVHRVLTKEQYATNAGLMTLIDQLTKVAAPAAAAAFVTWSAPLDGFLLSTVVAAAGFPVALQVRHAIRGIAAPERIAGGRGTLAIFGKLIRDNPRFRTAYAVALWQSTILGLYDPLLAVFLKQQSFPAGVFGIVISFTAMGAIFGAISFRRLHPIAGERISPPALACFGLTVLLPGVGALAGIVMPAYVYYGLWLVNGCCYGLASMTFVVILQRVAPAGRIGALSSLARSSQLSVLVTTPLLGALAADLVGIPMVFTLAGAGAIAGGVLLLNQVWRFK